MNNDAIGFAHEQKSAVRLNRAGVLNLLAFAIGKIGLPEGGRRGRACRTTWFPYDLDFTLTIKALRRVGLVPSP